MKHLKKLFLVLCMVTCFFALTACSKTDDNTNAVDATIASSLQMIGTNYLDMFVNMTDTDLVSYRTQAEQSKDTVFLSGLDSWDSVKSELGALVSVDNIDVTKLDEGYSISVSASFEQRKADFTMGVNEEVNAYTSFSISPVYTVGENMVKAALNTLMGMGTVFIVLIFISWLIGQFKHINAWEKKQREKALKAAPAAIPAPAPVVEQYMEEVDAEDELELVAVITAAVAASMNTSADGLVVRSIKRVQGTSKWKRA